MKALCGETKIFWEYVKRNRWQILIFNALLLLVWLPWLFDITPKIDNEILINTPYTSYNWLEIGRQGGILTEYVFGIRWFNPYFVTLFGYLLICVAGILFGYLFYRAGLKSRLLSTGFGLLCFSAPIMAEQFYFQMQIFKVAWAYVLCAAAAGLSLKAVISRNFFAQIIAFLCMLWCFSTYQVFLILYVAIIVACFVLLHRKWTLRDEQSGKKYARFITELILGFVAAFLVNTLITNLFFSSGNEYLDAQIMWKSQPFAQCLNNIYTHLKKGFTGDGVFFTAFYGVLSVCVFAAAVVQICRAKNRYAWGLYLAAILGLQILPFVLTAAFGNAPVMRAQLVYPFVLAVDLILLSSQLGGKKYWCVVPIVLAVLVFRAQVFRTERLIYTDSVRAQEDVRLAEELNARIDGCEKPIAFVGVYQKKLNNASVCGEMIGASVFAFDENVEPHYFYSGTRAVETMQTLGFNWKLALPEQVAEARTKAVSMPCWPAKESIADAGDYIIVKFSDDAWPEDFMDTGVQETVFEKPVRMADSTELQCFVDSAQTIDLNLSVVGWAFLNGVDSTSVTTSVYLYDEDNNAYFALLTAKKQRPDLISAFENGALYEYGGYSAKADISGLEKPIGAYKLYVGIETKDEVIMADTKYPLS